jgi:hypothetical protein
VQDLNCTSDKLSCDLKSSCFSLGCIKQFGILGNSEYSYTGDPVLLSYSLCDNCRLNGATHGHQRVGKPIGKHPQVKPRSRWEGNIKIGVEEICGDDGRWLDVAEGRFR